MTGHLAEWGGVLIFANPYSGHRDNRPKVEALAQALGARGVEVKVVWEAGSRVAEIKAAGSHCKAVVAAGGDGSVAAVVNAMAMAGQLGKVPFATLPVGTENLFAQAMQFEVTPEELAQAIVQGVTRPLDLGWAGTPEQMESGGGHYFTLMMTRGFDAHVVHRMDRWRAAASGVSGESVLRRVNRWSYAPRVLAGLASYRYPKIQLETNTGQVVQGVQAFVFNLNRYGGGFPLGAHAVADDGVLDWVVFQNPGRLRLLYYHWLAGRRRHLKSPSVVHGQAAGVKISAVGEAVPGQADGDPLANDATHVQVCPGALRVVVVPREGLRGRGGK
ncbi:MAG: diacylglycerol kinase family protein [Algisphaera sp.]